MSTGINIAPSSDLTVGTTAVTSGTDGRVFFQAGGVVQQDANFTYDNTLKRLGLKAVGTAATDIPLSISNSAGTVTNFKIQGNETIVFQSGPFATCTFVQDINQAATLMVRTTGNSQAELGNDFNAAPGSTYTGALKLYNWSSSLRTRIQAVGTSYLADSTSQLVIGSSTAGARLDVRAQGALSTDIAFRVRNSADTADIAAVQGNGNILFNNTTHGLLFNSQTVGSNQLELYSYGIPSVIVNPFVSRFAFTGASSVKGVVIGNSSTAPAALLDVWDFAGPGPGTTVARFGSQYNSTGADNLNILFSTRYSGFTASTAHLGRLNVGQTGSGASTNARSYFKFELIRNNTLAERASITSQSNLLLQTPTEDTNDIGVIYIPNGTAPTVALAGGGKLYVEGGALKYIGSSGTITTVAPA